MYVQLINWADGDMSLRGVRRDSAGRHAKTRNAGMHKREGKRNAKRGNAERENVERKNDLPNWRLGCELKPQLKGWTFVKRGEVKTFTVPWGIKALTGILYVRGA